MEGNSLVCTGPIRCVQHLLNVDIYVCTRPMRMCGEEDERRQIPINCQVVFTSVGNRHGTMRRIGGSTGAGQGWHDNAAPGRLFHWRLTAHGSYHISTCWHSPPTAPLPHRPLTHPHVQGLPEPHILRVRTKPQGPD